MENESCATKKALKALNECQETCTLWGKIKIYPLYTQRTKEPALFSFFFLVMGFCYFKSASDVDIAPICANSSATDVETKAAGS
jgi:hypothetical protein